MASYRIEWKPSAVKDLRSLDRSAVPKIMEEIGHAKTEERTPVTLWAPKVIKQP